MSNDTYTMDRTNRTALPGDTDTALLIGTTLPEAGLYRVSDLRLEEMLAVPALTAHL